MVPDLKVAANHRDAAFCRLMITEGRAQTLMPAFARAHGGPLSDEQITSLVDYLLAGFPGVAVTPLSSSLR